MHVGTCKIMCHMLHWSGTDSWRPSCCVQCDCFRFKQCETWRNHAQLFCEDWRLLVLLRRSKIKVCRNCFVLLFTRGNFRRIRAASWYGNKSSVVDMLLFSYKAVVAMSRLVALHIRVDTRVAGQCQWRIRILSEPKQLHSPTTHCKHRLCFLWYCVRYADLSVVSWALAGTFQERRRGQLPHVAALSGCPCVVSAWQPAYD